MVIWPLSPRATSLPARRRRSRVGSARRSTVTGVRCLLDSRSRASLALIFALPLVGIGCFSFPSLASISLHRSSHCAFALLPSPGAKRRGEGLGVGAPPAPPASASRRSRPQIGARAVRGTVRLIAQNLRAAEEEGRRARLADRPLATAVAQRKERAALGNRDLRVEARIFEVAFGLEQRRRRSHPVQGEGAPAHVLRPRRARNVLQLLPPPGRAAIGRQSRNAEAMDLRDHRVRADPQLSTDLARPRPLLPAPAQMAQAFLGPWQGGGRAWRPRQVERI